MVGVIRDLKQVMIGGNLGAIIKNYIGKSPVESRISRFLLLKGGIFYPRMWNFGIIMPFFIFPKTKERHGRMWRFELESRKNLFPPKRDGNRLVEQPTIIERLDGSIFCLMHPKPPGKSVSV